MKNFSTLPLPSPLLLPQALWQKLPTPLTTLRPSRMPALVVPTLEDVWPAPLLSRLLPLSMVMPTFSLRVRTVVVRLALLELMTIVLQSLVSRSIGAARNRVTP